MSARHNQTPSRQSAALAETSLDEVAVIGFKGAQAGVEKLALGYYDDVKPLRDFIATKDLSNQSFSSISLDRSADLPGGRDAKPSHSTLVGEQKHRAVAAVDANAALVHLLELGPAADVLGWTESQSYSLLTVRRLRPFARRRFSTRRPFFVLIRVRNPCALAR